MTPRNLPARWLDDLRCALGLLTRLPVGPPDAAADWSRCTRAFSLVGALVGTLGALAFWAADGLGLPSLVAALIAVATTLLVTGALHEDGLADVADGFGGGRDKANKLEIMRDSRIGTYGACALILSILLRTAALAAIAQPAAVFAALVAAHALARATLPLVMWTAPLARSQGLAASIARPCAADVAIAFGFAAVLTLFLLGWSCGLLSLVLVLLATYVMLAIARRQIAGYTGDVLGTIEQLGEAAILLAAAAQL